jgi:hypothetical protein
MRTARTPLWLPYDGPLRARKCQEAGGRVSLAMGDCPVSSDGGLALPSSKTLQAKRRSRRRGLFHKQRAIGMPNEAADEGRVEQILFAVGDLCPLCFCIEKCFHVKKPLRSLCERAL